MPSSSIDRSSLTTVSDVMERHPGICGEGNISLLTLRLAEEVFFGRDMLMLCTPKGARGRPSLPIKELSDLKVILFGQYPSCWCNPEKFEEVWNNTLDKLGQLCKRLRDKNKK
jgi:hypothetical protein